MSLRLILARHAKSSWDAPGLDDHARPLNARGRQAAADIGAWLAARGEAPDLVLSSDSVRTRQTWDRMAGSFAQGPRLHWTHDLYLAGPGTMLAALRYIGGNARCVLMLGHNPGTAQFASAMLDRAPDHSRFADYPTCATLIADFPAARWTEVAPATGQTVAFTVPRDLAG